MLRPARARSSSRSASPAARSTREIVGPATRSASAGNGAPLARARGLAVLEASTPQLDDVVRLEDRYGRRRHTGWSRAALSSAGRRRPAVVERLPSTLPAGARPATARAKLVSRSDRERRSASPPAAASPLPSAVDGWHAGFWRWIGAAQARAAARRMADERTMARQATTSRISLSRPRASSASTGPTGRCRCCRDPRALREREAARGLPDLRLPARHDRDGQPRCAR